MQKKSDPFLCFVQLFMQQTIPARQRRQDVPNVFCIRSEDNKGHHNLLHTVAVWQSPVKMAWHISLEKLDKWKSWFTLWRKIQQQSQNLSNKISNKTGIRDPLSWTVKTFTQHFTPGWEHTNHQLLLNPRKKRIKAGLEHEHVIIWRLLGTSRRGKNDGASVGSASAGGPENNEKEGIRKDQEQQCPLPRALCNNSQFLLETTILALTLKGQVEMPAACFHHCTPTCSSCVRSSRGAVILWATLIQHLIYKHCHELSHTVMYVYHAFMSTYVRNIIHKWHIQCLLMLDQCLIVWTYYKVLPFILFPWESMISQFGVQHGRDGGGKAWPLQRPDKLIQWGSVWHSEQSWPPAAGQRAAAVCQCLALMSEA